MCKMSRCQLLVVGVVSVCLLFITPTWAASSNTKGIAKLEHQATKSLCKSLRNAMGNKDFAKSFGRRHGIRSCAAKNRRYMISTRDDLKKKCISYRKRNPDAFRSKYGSCCVGRPENAWADSDPPDMCDATSAERITMTLPFTEANRPESLGPMGETITHPKPQHPRGHPGIDFQWDGSASKQLIASASGVVVTIKNGFYPNTWDLYIVSGCYRIGYGVLGSVAPSLSEGSTVQKGDFIGSPAHSPGTGADMSGFHWEFGYNNVRSLYPFRICPMTYFDDSSVQRIEAIWATSTFERKDLFPHICSGDFYGLDS